MLNYSNNNHKTINLMETITIHFLKILIQTIEKKLLKNVFTSFKSKYIMVNL